MGYRYIAIGGLVRNQTRDIIKVLSAVQEVLPHGMQVHLFGVSRPELMRDFQHLGVTSFDSASRLRRAWMDGRRNYFLDEEAFTAIRVPEARSLVRRRDVDEEEALRLERLALDTLRAYSRGEAHLNETHAAIAAYAMLAGDDMARVRRDYWHTLRERPWQRCQCAVCREVSVEVIIFRGNNRNRRRGFHNTWQLYRQLQAAREGQQPEAGCAIQTEMHL